VLAQNDNKTNNNRNEKTSKLNRIYRNQSMHISRGDVSLCCEEGGVSFRDGKSGNCNSVNSSVVVGDNSNNMKKRKLSSNKGASIDNGPGGVIGVIMGSTNSNTNTKNNSNIKNRNTSRNHHSSLSVLNRSSLEEEKLTEVEKKKVDKVRGDRAERADRADRVRNF